MKTRLLGFIFCILVTMCGFAQVTYTPYTTTTLAGLALSVGSTDGTGSVARFANPWGVAVDTAGNVYVADRQNSTIRKVTPAGVVTTLAGLAGSFGSADGTGSAAQFNGLTGVAVDSAGNVYVADTDNFTIRKVTSAGVATTLAGLAHFSGSADGTGIAAEFAYPLGVAVDSAGNVYVADTGNFTIRKVTPVGTNWVVTTLVGLAGVNGSTDGTGNSARFDGPYGVAVDRAGNVYVADTGNDTIRKVTSAGVVTTLVGLAGHSGSADGTGIAARFSNPSGVAVDNAGNVYVADTSNGTIRKVTPTGVVTTLAGLAGSFGRADGTGSAAQFADPVNVAVDSAGNFYVADYYNSTIRKGVPAGGLTIACSTNKTVPCGVSWSFDKPAVSSSCGGGVKITVVSTVTNAAAPNTITQSWLITDSCGNSNTCSQTVSLGSPPAVVSVYYSCGDTNILVAFSSPVTPTSALNVSNYQVSSGGGAVTIIKTAINEDSRIVTLSLSGPLQFGAAGGGLLSINGVQDLCGNTLTGYQTGLNCNFSGCAYGNTGTEFWLTFPGNYAPDTNSPPQVQLCISGPAGTIGSVSMPLLLPPFVASFTIPVSGQVTVPLPSSADLANANDIITSNGVHVVASASVTVDAFDHVAYTTDGYLGLPVKTLGSLYMALGYKNVFTGVPELKGSQFALVACHDNTTVTIIPSSTVGAHSTGVPFDVVLMQGQTYQLRNTNDAPADLTGTLIASSVPVAVFGGHQCADIPSSNVFFCDYVVEQLFPAALWGTNYVTAPLATRLIGDTFRCLALQTNTTVFTNGTSAAVLNQGGVAEFQLKNAAQITSTKPILVAQYGNSSDYDGVVNSDSLMMLVPPTTLYSSIYQVTTPATNYFPSVTNFINITAPASAVGQVVLEGSSIPAGKFSAIGTSGYYAAQVSVPAGLHNLSSSNGLAFGIQVYGWSLYDAYGYPGGICSPQVAAAPEFACPTNIPMVIVTTNCLAAVPDFSKQIGNAGEAVLITQKPAAGTFLGPGTYPVTLTLLDALGNRHVCENTLTVSSGDSPGLECPPDMVVTARSSSGVAVSFAAALCNTNFTLTYSPPSGSIFPPGTSIVKVTAGNAAFSQSCNFSVIVKYLAINAGLLNGKLAIEWTGGAVLQQATSPRGPWTEVKNVTSPYQPPMIAKEGYFRAVQVR